MTESARQADALSAYTGEAIYGSEWGDPEESPWLLDVRDNWLLPHICQETTAVEIGSGGGRWSRYFQPCKLTYLIDATPKSEELIRGLCDCERFRFILSPDGKLLEIADDSVDYVFSFDTFVHFDRPLFDAYLGEIVRVLKPDGVLHLHYAAEVGTVTDRECFKYRDPLEIVETLRANGLRVARSGVHAGGLGSILVECFKE